MSDADKFLQQLEQLRLKNKEKRTRLRTEYKEAKKLDRRLLEKEFFNYIRMGADEASKKESEIQAYAAALMDRGVSGNDYSLTKYDLFNFALNGARLYEKIGKGKKAIPRLLKAAEINKDILGSNEYEKIKSFIEKNAKRKPHSGSLESRVGIFILATLGGIALSVSSLTATGSAISNLLGTTKGLLGVLLFIAGLVGILFYSKRL